MTTNTKFNRHIEIGESIGAFMEQLSRILEDAFRPAFEWGENYWKARNRGNRRWPA